jgi:hypothetical protein
MRTFAVYIFRAMDQEKINTLRIKILCNFLDQGGGTLQEMHAYLNAKLEEADLDIVQLRTLQSLIEKLRKGQFNHSLQGFTRSKNQNVFNVNYHNKIYTWHVESPRPEFGDLDENERYTLPFLSGILKKYESIPAVRKILDSLPDLFGVSEAEMDSASVVYHGGAELYDSLNPNVACSQKVIELAIKLLGHINRREKIEFLYHPVSLQDDLLPAARHHSFVSPMQIRFYNEYYYLTAINKDRIMNYRIDLIAGPKVDVQTDEEDNIVYFDPIELERKFKLKDHFKHVLGIWNHEEDSRVYTIRIRFREWAASYVKKLKFHPTQELCEVNTATSSIVVSFKLKLGKEQFPNQPVMERSPELSFFLGRFREYAEVLSAVPV